MDELKKCPACGGNVYLVDEFTSFISYECAECKFKCNTDDLDRLTALTDNQRKWLELAPEFDEEKYEYEWKHSDNATDWRDIQVQDYQELCRTLIRRPRKPMKQTRIISAFPGTGKTYFVENNTRYTALDSDSSQFSWVTLGDNKVRHPDWPQNYMDHIKDNIGKVDFILVSTHKEVRDALKLNCLFFYLVHPTHDLKEAYNQRYVDRGSPQAFIDLLDTQWDEWLNELYMETCCERLSISYEGSYLEEKLRGIIARENGDKIV